MTAVCQILLKNSNFLRQRLPVKRKLQQIIGDLIPVMVKGLKPFVKLFNINSLLVFSYQG
jgi:hypothetical protein